MLLHPLLSFTLVNLLAYRSTSTDIRLDEVLDDIVEASGIVMQIHAVTCFGLDICLKRL